ncbi:DEAD/DEAH box helicase [Halodesulfovibrio sp.]|jgi:hypothetical protein|uniref:DEAD/DEAH box helicase n=1 Tax=Halodesulfovibrio sp. TaxID=1912772 RepID=UPI0025EE4017|nr:DEAD/DEAH box helicase [Halodesulfovibrio sp.]MCT4535175.1 helicase-related protein [Halodesulfovibrio sp.]
MNYVDGLALRAAERMKHAFSVEDFFTKEVRDIQKGLEDVYKMLQSSSTYTQGVSYLCRFCENYPDDKLCRELIGQCIGSSRIFLYEEMLEKKGCSTACEDLFSSVQKAFYSLPGDLVLTKEQKDLFDLFKTNRKLVVSAPTSFGKSRIIREIVVYYDYKQVVLIVPTNALLSETYVSFLNDKRFDQTDLIYSTHIPPSKNRAVYIFTPEKFDAYSDEHEIDFDFFVFDEVYKVDSRDNRSSVYSSCLYKAYKKRCDYYLIGPYFKKFSDAYLEKTAGYFSKFSTDIVQKELYTYSDDCELQVGKTILPSRRTKISKLKEIVRRVDGQTIVYVSRKDSAESKAKELVKICAEVENQLLEEVIEYISETISDEWSLISCLRNGVAFHHAGIPKYIQTELVDLFNAQILQVIVCTPTLTEGVNTSAKNVVFFDNKKADIPLTGFETKNIIGRSGRFGHHFIGRAFSLGEELQQEEIEKIDFPIFDYESVSKEDNLQIDLDDLPPSGKEQRKEILDEVRQKRVPITLLKKNKYIKFENQLALIEFLRANQTLEGEVLFSGSLPTKGQLDTIIELIHDILFSESDVRRNWTTGALQKFTAYQVYYQPNIKELVSEYNAVREDTRIRNVLTLIYEYFEFKFPKYFMAFEHLFNFVYSASLNLSPLIIHLQYGTDRIQDILLIDAGVPVSIVKKVSKHLSGAETIVEIKHRLRQQNILALLSKVEQRMLLKRI